ncbi:MAG: DUF3822 family protein [Chitinophagaceae bacterium]
MVQKTFGIYSADLSKGKLFIELGKNHLAAWTKEVETAKILSLELFQFTNLDAEYFTTSWQEIQLLSKLLIENTPLIILENEDCSLIPEDLLNEDQLKKEFSLMHNGPVEKLHIERVPAAEMVLVNDVHIDALTEIQKTFPTAFAKHKYAEILRQMKSQEEENLIKIYFYTSYFIAVVFKEHQLQLIRHFNFQTPEDALYYILLACKQSGLPQTTPVEASGMIDTDSPLYKTLYRYLEGFRLETPLSSIFETTGFSEFPLHYFSVFCND